MVYGKTQTVGSLCGIFVDMSQKVPSPKDLLAAAQAAAETRAIGDQRSDAHPARFDSAR
jgi:hypothetical protein